MSILTEQLPLYNVVWAAMIAGLVSFLVTVLSKEQKTSEFRQAWIDALREDLSKYASLNVALAYYVPTDIYGVDAVKTFNVKYFNELKEIESLHIKILLRLNFNEEKHILLIEKIDALINFSNHDIRRDRNSGKKLIDEFVLVSKLVLKDEWKRVKRGEIVFLITKYGSISFFLIAFICVIAYINDHFEITYVF